MKFLTDWLFTGKYKSNYIIGKKQTKFYYKYDDDMWWK